LDKGINNLLKLDSLYETADIEKKREIISSMYPEKMTFNEFSFRTSRINEVARMIYSLDEDYSENEKGQSGNIPALSSKVGMTGFEPAASSSRTKRATGLRYIPKEALN
jgi:site-specific DNA recombinase